MSETLGVLTQTSPDRAMQKASKISRAFCFRYLPKSASMAAQRSSYARSPGMGSEVLQGTWFPATGCCRYQNGSQGGRTMLRGYRLSQTGSAWEGGWHFVAGEADEPCHGEAARPGHQLQAAEEAEWPSPRLFRTVVRERSTEHGAVPGRDLSSDEKGRWRRHYSLDALCRATVLKIQCPLWPLY